MTQTWLRNEHVRYMRITDKNKWCWDYKISIVIPTRGRVELLKNCLLSILDKSFKSNRLFEIILVIDYDDDETLKFLNNFQIFLNLTAQRQRCS